MPIELKKVNFSYGINTPFEKKALNDINLKINEGELWLFIGHTGSGKSTLLNTLNGLIIPDGRVTVDNVCTKDKSTDMKELRKKVGIIFQYPESQFFLPTIAEELLYAPKNFNIDLKREEIKFYMDIVGLPYDYLNRSPFGLSGGEMRKVAIISVLSYNPKYIIFDEPTVGLDYSTRKSVFNTVKKLNRMGKTIILSTHWISEFLELKPLVAIMQNSNLIFKGTFDEFIKLDKTLLSEAGIIFDEKLELYKKALLKNDKLKDKIAML